LTLRAIIVAVVLSVLSIFWIHQASLVQAPGNYYAPVYLLSVPPVPAVVCLIVLVALTPITLRLLRGKLEDKELLVIFMFLVVAIPPVTFGVVEMLIPWMGSPTYFHNPQNNFMQLADALPRWSHPQDPEVIRQMYEGSDDGSVPWSAWAVPLGMWGLFMSLLFFTGMCVVSLFRKQWAERERLRFPLLFIPVSIVQREALGSRTSFFRNPLVWLAFAIVIAHHVLNVLHAYNPAVKCLGDRYAIGAIFTEYPWTHFRGLSFFQRPQIIGLAYFVGLDVLFSGWFFFLMGPLLAMLTDMFGLQATPGFPFVQQQGTGAYLALAVTLFWIGRQHIAAIVRKTFHNDASIDDSAEYIPYRWALLGAVGGFVVLIAWTHAMGLSASVGIPYFMMLLAFGLVYSRLRSEAGVPTMYAFPFHQDIETIQYAIGTRGLIKGPDISNLVMLTAFAWVGRGYFTSQFAYQIENEALAGQQGIKTRGLALMMMGAFILGCLVAYYAILKSYYGFGALVLHGGSANGGYNIQLSLGAWNSVSSAVETPGPPNLDRMLAIGAGAVVILGLVGLRTLWLRSPFHPLGYLATLNHGYALWAPFLVAWILKSIIHALGGARLFRQLMPFFLGLVMADLLAGGLSWVVMAVFGPDSLAGYIVHFG